jgi:phage-related protein
MKRLGDGYEAWVKSGNVEFLHPARSTLSATVTLDNDEVDEIEASLEERSSVERTYSVDLLDDEDTICATVETTVHITKADDS